MFPPALHVSATATNTILKQVRPSDPGPIAFTPDGTTACEPGGLSISSPSPWHPARMPAGSTGRIR